MTGGRLLGMALLISTVGCAEGWKSKLAGGFTAAEGTVIEGAACFFEQVKSDG